MAPSNHQKPKWHLEGFLFPDGQDPMEAKQHIRTILQQRTYMPGKRDRGNADGFLRFETNLSVIFQVVKHLSSAWGHRDFWYNVRTCLAFHHNTTEQNLAEIVEKYCAGRNAYCNSLRLDPRHVTSQPPSRIASLADFIIGLPKDSAYEPSPAEWEELKSSWKSRLHGILQWQGVLSSQVRDGTCAPELLPQRGANAPAPASMASRVTVPVKDPREVPARSDSTGRESHVFSDVSCPDSITDDARYSTIEHPASKPNVPGSYLTGNHVNEYNKRVEYRNGGSGPGAEDIFHVKQRTQRVQSLDELVTDYSSCQQPPVFESRNQTNESNTLTKKRPYVHESSDRSRSPKRFAKEVDASTALERNCTIFDIPPEAPSAGNCKEMQVEKDVSSIQIDDAIDDFMSVNVTIPDKLSTSKSMGVSQIGNLPNKNNKLMFGKNANTHFDGNCTIPMTNLGEHNEVPSVVNMAVQVMGGVTEPLGDPENRQQRFNEEQGLIGAMHDQLAQHSPERERIENLEAQLNDMRSDLTRHSSQHVSMTIFKSQMEDLRQQLTARPSDQERINHLEIQLEDFNKRLSRHLSEPKSFATFEAELKSLHSLEQSRVDDLQSQLENLNRQLTVRSSDQQRVNCLESIVEGLQNQLSSRSHESQQIDKLEAAVNDLHDRLNHPSSVQQRVSKLELMVHGLSDQSSRSLNMQQISERVDTQLRDLREKVDRQATYMNATEAQIGRLQEQLKDIQERLSQTGGQTATLNLPPSPLSMNINFMGSADVRGFLNGLYSEMTKVRLSMKARIQEMDAAGEPDDHRKYAISDISFELGRVLELVKKRINSL